MIQRCPLQEPSVSQLLSVLRRFRECCKFRGAPINEREVQDVIWIMIRALYERVEREETLARFGTKQSRPDFGIPELGVLIEVKFIGVATSEKTIQDEIIADIPGYLAKGSYTGVVVVVYDHAHKLSDSTAFEEDLKTVDGILDVIVIPGLSSISREALRELAVPEV